MIDEFGIGALSCRINDVGVVEVEQEGAMQFIVQLPSSIGL